MITSMEAKFLRRPQGVVRATLKRRGMQNVRESVTPRRWSVWRHLGPLKHCPKPIQTLDMLERKNWVPTITGNQRERAWEHGKEKATACVALFSHAHCLLSPALPSALPSTLVRVALCSPVRDALCSRSRDVVLG
jgi:hypothetical protein